MIKIATFEIEYFWFYFLSIVLIWYFTDAVPPPSENNPSLQINVSLDKSDSTITNTVTENCLQMPLKKRSTAKGIETLTTLPAFWSSKEEFISPNLRTSKSDSTFYDQASVETLYVSPSFKMFDSLKEIVINADSQKSTQPSIAQTDNENLKTLTTLGESEKKNPPQTNKKLL